MIEELAILMHHADTATQQRQIIAAHRARIRAKQRDPPRRRHHLAIA